MHGPGRKTTAGSQHICADFHYSNFLLEPLGVAIGPKGNMLHEQKLCYPDPVVRSSRPAKGFPTGVHSTWSKLSNNIGKHGSRCINDDVSCQQPSVQALISSEAGASIETEKQQRRDDRRQNRLGAAACARWDRKWAWTTGQRAAACRGLPAIGEVRLQGRTSGRSRRS